MCSERGILHIVHIGSIHLLPFLRMNCVCDLSHTIIGRLFLKGCWAAEKSCPISMHHCSMNYLSKLDPILNQLRITASCKQHNFDLVRGV